MAIRTFVKNLFAKITGKERREKEVVMIRFRNYQSSARMLAIALERGMEFVPNFLENTTYIEYLTLTFKDNNNTLSIFLLPELRKFGFENQAEALEAVNNSSQVLCVFCKDESRMREYIKLLWSLFHTPDPE
jgi:hypothetical protein